MRTIYTSAFIVWLIFINLYSFSQTKRALMIGVDTYYPENADLLASKDKSIRLKRISNLDGCVNDVLAVKEIIVSRFLFPQENIATLTNQDASRDAIIKAFEKLINDSKKGDYVMIYYAGHGSQVRNSLSNESDGKDETMVPADAFKSIPHIRDKELAVLFNRLVEKGVILTVIYDSCHSGSIGRGALTEAPPKSRFTDPDTSDVRDAAISPEPEKKGALIISAAQDDEIAMEQRDENGNPHGAFTYAFLQTMKTAPINASAKDVFSSMRAIMKYNGKKQEPVLAGNDDRLNKTLFGIDKGALSGKTQVAVMKNENKDNITLQGGYAVGLNVNSKLFKLLENKDSICLRVTEMKGINKCIAKIEKGSVEKIKAGDLYELGSWSSAAGPTIKIYVPKTTYSFEEMQKVATNLSVLKNNKSITWITDPTKEVATHTVFFNGTDWFLGTPDGKTTNLGKAPADKAISKLITGNAKLFVSIPPFVKLRESLLNAYKQNNAIEVTDVASDAQYYLAGRINNTKLEYAYMLPVATKEDAETNPMPVRTDFISMNPANADYEKAVDTLETFSLKLAKLKAWLTLAGPTDDGSFPFFLSLKNVVTNEIVAGGNVFKGDQLGLVLLADKGNMDYWDGSKRFVYVMNIDSKGTTQLCYPTSSVENKFPKMDEAANAPKKEMALGSKKLITIDDPLGIDTYIMLTTDEPLPNPEMLNQSGVRSRGTGGSGLSQLMNVGAATRGTISTPSSWSIQRISVKCLEKK